MLDRLLSLLVAVGLALLVFLYTRSRDQDVLDNVNVPVKVVVATRQAENYSLEVQADAQVSVSFSGPPARLRELHGMLQRNELQVVKTITVPDDRLDSYRITELAVIETGDLNAPVGVTALVKEGHNRVPYTLWRLAEKRLPVRFDHIRSEPAGEVQLEPKTVLVRGPRELLDRLESVPTQPAELPTRPLRAPISVAAIGRVAMVEELEGRAIKVTPASISVRVPGQAFKTYELVDVQINFLLPPRSNFMPRFPNENGGKVTLKVTGPVGAEPPRACPYVDLTSWTNARVPYGLNTEKVHVELPHGYTLEQQSLQSASFDVVPVDSEGLSLPARTPKALPTRSPP